MGRSRIFVVEDDAGDVQLMRQVLGEIDADVEFAGDAETAVRRLRRQHAKGFDPDLLILDIDLPGESGISMLRRLRKTFLNSVPVMMFTGSESLIEQEEAESLGIVAYLSKPFELVGYAQFTEVVKQLLTRGSQPTSRLSARG
jgi:CheY-like chemotaxis protein